MKKKKTLQIKITTFVGVLLAISNALLVFLLNKSSMSALGHFVIPIDGMTIEVYNYDDFSNRIMMYGVIIAISATFLGTMLTYFILGRVLSPLKKLSDEMSYIDKSNLTDHIDVSASTREIESLITSFNDMLAKLKKSFDVQKNSTSYLAHELKTPLAVMQAKLEVFKKENHSLEDLDGLIFDVEKQVKKLVDVVTKINELNEVTRLELNDKIPVKLLMEELVQDLEPVADVRDVHICIEEIFSESLFIMGNHTLLYQAFFNILENAIKYSHAGDEVSVNMMEMDSYIRVEVADRGIGISDEAKAFVFDPFYRAKNAFDKTGMGMGLALAKTVFEHHRAKCEMMDNSPSGTIVRVDLKK